MLAWSGYGVNSRNFRTAWDQEDEHPVRKLHHKCHRNQTCEDMICSAYIIFPPPDLVPSICRLLMDVHANQTRRPKILDEFRNMYTVRVVIADNDNVPVKKIMTGSKRK